MLPTVVVRECEIDLHERAPFRALGFADEMHARFLRSAIRFESVALDTRTNNVLPSGRSSAIPGQHMIQIQILSVARFAAVLAGVLIALENIVARELHLFLGDVIVDQQQYYTRDAQSKRNRADRFRVRVLGGQVLPLRKVEGLKRTVVAVKDSLRMTLKQQGQCPSRRADIDRLPEPIQHQHVLV